MLNLVSSKIMGTPGASGYSEIDNYLPDDTGGKASRGHLFTVVSKDQFEDKIAARVRDAYFSDLNSRPFNALKIAVEKVSQDFSLGPEGIEIAAVAFTNGTAYCASSGGSKVAILRDGALAVILESNDVEVVSASGYPKTGDQIILGTKKFFDRMTIRESNIHTSLEGDSGRVAACILKFENEILLAASKVTSFFKKVTDSLPERKIFIKQTPEFEMESQGKKVTLSIGIILLLILGISVVFGIRQKNINELKKKYEGTLTEASANLDEATGLVAVSPDKARELFVAAQEKLAQVEAFNAKDPKIEELRARIEEQKSAAFGEYKATPELFLDLTLLSSGFKGDKLSASEGNLFVLDRAGKKIVSIEVDSKKSRVVAGPDKIGNVSDMASYSDRVFVLDSEGVKEVDEGTTTVIEKDWEGDAFIYGFAGNIYILDKSANQIYRYAGSGDTFGSRQNWLSSSTKPDFSSAKTWVIDGAVYVLDDTGKVQKFSLGSPQTFSLNGIFPGLTSIDSIYSSDETEFIYILNKTEKRVVVLDKKGNYKAQYTADEISNAESLIVSEAEKKIIILTGDKLLSIEIKHI